MLLLCFPARVESAWRTQIAVQYRADFALGPYDILNFTSQAV
jgi:hypothetical protein